MRSTILFLVFITFISCSGGEGNNSSIKVACAANMQYAMDSIAVVFEEKEGIACEIISNSSGMLTSQIRNGAPYDILLSANMIYPNTLFDEGEGEKPFIYAKGRLILAFPKALTYSNVTEALNDTLAVRVAMADPKTAPYGMAAEEYLINTNQKSTLESKLIIGESIGQVNQYLTTAAVDMAFTAFSFVVENGDAYNYLEVDQELFTPINQGAIILNYGRSHHAQEVDAFVKFLQSPECIRLLKHFGYLAD